MNYFFYDNTISKKELYFKETNSFPPYRDWLKLNYDKQMDQDFCHTLSDVNQRYNYHTNLQIEYLIEKAKKLKYNIIDL